MLDLHRLAWSRWFAVQERECHHCAGLSGHPVIEGTGVCMPCVLRIGSMIAARLTISTRLLRGGAVEITVACRHGKIVGRSAVDDPNVPDMAVLAHQSAFGCNCQP